MATVRALRQHPFFRSTAVDLRRRYEPAPATVAAGKKAAARRRLARRPAPQPAAVEGKTAPDAEPQGGVGKAPASGVQPSSAAIHGNGHMANEHGPSADGHQAANGPGSQSCQDGGGGPALDCPQAASPPPTAAAAALGDSEVRSCRIPHAHDKVGKGRWGVGERPLLECSRPWP